MENKKTTKLPIKEGTIRKLKEENKIDIIEDTNDNFIFKRNSSNVIANSFFPLIPITFLLVHFFGDAQSKYSFRHALLTTKFNMYFIIGEFITIVMILLMCYFLFISIKNDMETKVQVNHDELTIKEKILFIPIKEKKFKRKELKIETIEIEEKYFSIIFKQEKISFKKTLNFMLSKREANYLVNKINSLC